MPKDQEMTNVVSPTCLLKEITHDGARDSILALEISNLCFKNIGSLPGVPNTKKEIGNQLFSTWCIGYLSHSGSEVESVKDNSP
ncbi:hypothetical protein HAX54_043966 [Datura stramonium]|uniref:Uncharacterized protein n=1 Tax=Datura stramonium TaxID=4076 RepID=A0ABS8W3B3_DATST|nr:hypothetical protein [Datura stramonium]